MTLIELVKYFRDGGNFEQVEKVTFDLGMKQMNFTGFKWGIRPDVAVLFKNKSVIVFEVVSYTQTKMQLQNKLIDFSLKYNLKNNSKVYNPFFLPKTFKKF